MAKTSKSQFAVLGMLGVLKKASGYDIKKQMESTTHYFWKETFSSIYPVLEDLEKKKLIEKVEKAEKKNDRARNVYTLTPRGRATLEQWLAETPETMQLRNELLLKLFFGTMAPIKVSIEHVEKQKKEFEIKLRLYREIKKELSKNPSLEALYSLITLDHGIRQASSALEWCDSTIKTLESARQPK